MFAQPRLIHNSHVSFYTSRNFHCQEFIDLGLKLPGNLCFLFHLHLRVPEDGLRPGWWRVWGTQRLVTQPQILFLACADSFQLLPLCPTQFLPLQINSVESGPCLLSTFALLCTSLQPDTGLMWMAQCWNLLIRHTFQVNLTLILSW